MVGNLKNYTKIDVIRCLLKIDKPVSRSSLSEILDLGEGTIRSILDVLKEEGLIDSNKNGHYLGSKGNNIMQRIKKDVNIKKVRLKNFFPEQKKIAVHIKSPKNVEKAYLLRDIAVKNGAEGAIILRYDKHDKKLKISDAEIEEDFSEIESELNLSKDDLIIIAYSNSYRLAEHGALAVAVELNSDLKNLMSKFK